MTDAEVTTETDAANKKFGNSTTDALAVKGQVIYRVQLGAYKNKLSPSMFKNVGNVIEMKTDDGFYRYASGTHKTMNDAAHQRADLVLEGYSDAFITAYKNGKRIPLSEAGATYDDKSYKEDIKETHTAASAIDKSLLSFKIQIALKKTTDADFENRIKTLKDLTKQAAGKDLIRYLAGDFKFYDDAVKYKAVLIQQGFADVFIVGFFKGEVISVPEAMEIFLKE